MAIVALLSLTVLRLAMTFAVPDREILRYMAEINESKAVTGP
jgi:hypothetical protein